MLSMQYQCVNIVTNTINKVNPGQTPVDVCHFLIFALTTQFQWRYPEKFGNYFCLFGGCHIQKLLLLLVGGFVSDSGLLKLLGVTSPINDIKRAQCALKLSVLRVIYKNLLVAHSCSGSAVSHLDWLDGISTTSALVLYWKQIFQLRSTSLITFDQPEKATSCYISWLFPSRQLYALS